MKLTNNDVRFGTKEHSIDNTIKTKQMSPEQLERYLAGESMDEILKEITEVKIEQPKRVDIDAWGAYRKRNEERLEEKELKEVNKIHDDLTKEIYLDHKTKGLSDDKIMEMYNSNNAKLNTFKKKHGLIGMPKVNQKSEKSENKHAVVHKKKYDEALETIEKLSAELEQTKNKFNDLSAKYEELESDAEGCLKSCEKCDDHEKVAATHNDSQKEIAYLNARIDTLQAQVREYVALCEKQRTDLQKYENVVQPMRDLLRAVL